MSEIRVNNITNREGSAGPSVAGIPVVDSNSHFVVPTGRTGQRYADGGENIVRDGLVLYLDAKYSYPGATGTNPDTYTWYDLSGYENQGELIGGVGYNAANGGSLVFDGSNQYATVTNGMNFLIGTSSVTFSAWIYRSSAPAYWAGIISNKVNVTEGICLLVNPDSKVFWQYDGGVSGVYAIEGGQSLSTNVWYNIVGVYDNIGLKTYVNGSLNDSANDAGKSISSSGNMNITIGAQDSVSGGPFPGRIANTSIYNRALSAAEVSQNYEALKGRYGLP